MFIQKLRSVIYPRQAVATPVDVELDLTAALGEVEMAAARQRRRRGYSLAELILGAAVIAAFLVRVYQSYAAANAADKYQDFTQEVGLLNGTIHETFINSPDYSGLDSAGTSLMGNLPRKYVNGAGTGVVNVYKQPVTFSTSTSSGATGADQFIIETKMNAADCTKTAFGDMGRNVVALEIGGANPIDLTQSNSAITTAATAACAAVATNTGLVDVKWTFN